MTIQLQYIQSRSFLFLSTSDRLSNILSSNYFFLRQRLHRGKLGFLGTPEGFFKKKPIFFAKFARFAFKQIKNKNGKRGRPKAVPSQPVRIIFFFIFLCPKQSFHPSTTPTTSHITPKNIVFYNILIRLLSRLTNLTPFTSTHTMRCAYCEFVNLFERLKD